MFKLTIKARRRQTGESQYGRETTLPLIHAGRLTTSTAGFWKGCESKGIQNRHLPARPGSLSSEQSPWVFIEVRGLVRWNKDRNIIDGKENFIKISNIHSNNTLAITKREIKEGVLFVSSEDGTNYKIYGLSPNFTATMEKIDVDKGLFSDADIAKLAQQVPQRFTSLPQGECPERQEFIVIRNERLRESPEDAANGDRMLDPGYQVGAKITGSWALVCRDNAKLGYLPQDALLKTK